MKQNSSWLLYAALALAYLALMHGSLPLAVLVVLKVSPIAMLFLLVARTPFAPKYLLIALLFSACGDALLAVPLEQGFIFGLSAFLLAQLSYAHGFIRARRPRIDQQAILRLSLLGVCMAAVAFIVLPASGDLILPVTVYFLAISTMAGTAAVHRCRTGALFAGAFIFVLSDSMIAIDKFVLPFEGSRYAIMLTYYLAQALIIRGVLTSEESDL